METAGGGARLPGSARLDAQRDSPTAAPLAGRAMTGYWNLDLADVATHSEGIRIWMARTVTQKCLNS